MKPVMTTLIAAALVCFSAGLSSTASAVQLGYVGPKDPLPQPRGPWEARVRWADPHTDPHSGVRYTYRYMTLIGATQQYCQQQLQSVLTNGNVSVVQDCRPI